MLGGGRIQGEMGAATVLGGRKNSRGDGSSYRHWGEVIASVKASGFSFYFLLLDFYEDLIAETPGTSDSNNNLLSS